MAKYNNQKAKILFLQQMLYETGENHTVSMQEILDLLLEKGIRAERKSIYDDMEVLRFFGMDIRYKRERPSGYYLAGTTAPKIVLEKPEIVYEPVPETEKKEERILPEGPASKKFRKLPCRQNRMIRSGCSRISWTVKTR